MSYQSLTMELDMSLETGIKNLLSSATTADSQLLSVRVPPSMINQIDELASELNKTRSDLVTVFISGGIEELVRQLNEKDIKENFFGIKDAESNKDTRYFLLNTNFNNSEADHFTMLENGEASAFNKPWKKYVEYLREGDVVFLYQSGYGIRGYGLADKELIIRDHNGNKNEWYSRKLNNFISDFDPVTAKKCKEVTKSNPVFRRTMVALTKAQGEALISEIKQQK